MTVNVRRANADTVTSRTAQRDATRKRLFDAAVAEIKRTGLVEADVAAIAASAGVSRASFYKYFPTKDHVLAELKDAEEARIAAALRARLTGKHDIRAALHELTRQILASERRLGRVLYGELLAQNFSMGRPHPDEWSRHPLVVVLADEIDAARSRGEVAARAEPVYSAVFVLLGLYALLTTSHGISRARTAAMDRFLEHELRALGVDIP